MSADRFRQAAKTNDSASWNKYSYTRGDPVNRGDRRGTCDESTDTSVTVCEDPPNCDGRYADASCPGGGGYPGGGGGGGGGDDEGHGGGGGGNSTPTSTIIGGNSDQQAQVKAGLTEAMRRITSSTKCKSFLDNDNYDGYAEHLLNNTEYRIIPLPGGPGVGAQTNSPTSVFINPNSSYFNQTVYGMPGQDPFYYADFGTGLTGVAYQALILLHELGHQTGQLGADINSAINRSNTQSILDNCFTAIGGGLYQ